MISDSGLLRRRLSRILRRLTGRSLGKPISGGPLPKALSEPLSGALPLLAVLDWRAESAK